MSDFEERLERAVQRGARRQEERQREASAKALSEEELKARHSKFRLQLSEHIEECLRKLPNYFPGFQLETMFGDRGWGAACSRDDVRIERNRRGTDYSRLELTIRPFSSYHVVDLSGKATVRNKEVFSRNYFEPIAECDPEKFIDLIDAWVLEYAEIYAARE